ncbi:MAG: hypothetical protein CMN32_16395 [Saprospirales bacterium]|nr:hypothetical protein [Saprospirales bacterium]
MRTPPLFQSYSFTRSERLALVIIAALAIFFCILPALYRVYHARFTEGKQVPDTAWMAAIKEEKTSREDESVHGSYEKTVAEKQPVTLFYFDPNLSSLEELRRLGLKERVANTIINYRNKGGKFRRKEDLKKIYGLPESEYRRLEDWIKIEPPKQYASSSVRNSGSNHEGPKPDSLRSGKRDFKKPYKATEKEPTVIDINQASIEEWQSLRGIGPAYSKRIVNFREKLGGFYSVEQVGETYGIPDSVFQKIRPYLKASPILKTIDLNQTDLSSLQKHPYISYKEAKVLFSYIQQHVPVTDMEQLRKAMSKIFTKERWEKLEPYLNLHR